MRVGSGRRMCCDEGGKETEARAALFVLEGRGHMKNKKWKVVALTVEGAIASPARRPPLHNRSNVCALSNRQGLHCVLPLICTAPQNDALTLSSSRSYPFLKPTLLLSRLPLPTSSLGVVTPNLLLLLPPANVAAVCAALDSATTQSSSRTLFSRSLRSTVSNNSFRRGPDVHAQKQPGVGHAPSEVDAEVGETSMSDGG